MSSDVHVALIDTYDLTDTERRALVDLCQRMYLGETCPYCKQTFDTLDDLKDTVWNGVTEYGRTAHTACWDAAHPDTELARSRATQ